MIKPKKIDVADSNIALLGSQLEKDVKKGAAETEAAWKGAGQKVGLEIWRIEKFKVVAWPKNEYGHFYSGDSYIVLSTKEKPSNAPKTKVMKDGKWVEIEKALQWDIHFWLGQYTSQDEAGTAAYKTVELDTLLDDAPVQHREVQGYESDEFMQLFNGKITIMDGGVDSGFKHVKPEEYKPRLMHVKGKKNVKVAEVELSYKSLNFGDVFILDAGLKLIQWNGSKANMMEKRKGGEVVVGIRDERNGKVSATVNECGQEDEFFWEALGGKPPAGYVIPAGEEDDLPTAGGHSGTIAAKGKPFVRKLFRLSDASGSLTFTLECEGSAVNKSKLDPKDVFVLDYGEGVYVWIGNETTEQERKRGLGYAGDYLKKEGRPSTLPIGSVKQGAESQAFWKAIA